MEVADEGEEYNARITWFLVLSCMLASTGGLIFGYDIAISGGVTSMDPFLEKFFPEVYSKMKENGTSNYCKFDSQLLTAFTSSLYIAGLIATFFASPITRTFGRKPSILIGGFAFLSGSALNGAAYNVYMLISGRVLLGVGLGFANQSVPLYLSEMAPPKHPGALNIGFNLCIGIGVLLVNLINYETEKIKGGWGWRVSLALAAAPASVLTLAGLLLPETPNSLIEHGNDHERAKQMLQRIRGTNDVQLELEDLIRASEVSKTIEHPFKNIFRRKYRPQLVMSTAIPFFQQVTGINVISFYALVLFRTVGLGESASLMSSVVTWIVCVCTIFVTMLVIDKLGRRVFFYLGGTLMFIAQMSTSGIMAAYVKKKKRIMAAKLGDHGDMSKGYGLLVIILTCIYIVGFSFSWGPLGWLVPSEIFSLEIRSAAQSINVAVGLFFIFLVAQTFLVMLCHFKSGIFFFFAGWVALMTGFVYLFLPETKSVPIEKMDKIWREHWFWKGIINEKEGSGQIKIEGS